VAEALARGLKNSRFIGGDLDCIAKRIKNTPKWQFHIAKEQILWRPLSL
jgi:hypothetical protein